MLIKNLILIGGGTGFIGKRLHEAFVRKGFTVKNISRQPGLYNIHWDVLKTCGLPTNTRAIVNVCGQNVLDFRRKWTPKFRDQVICSRIETTRTLAELIDRSDIKPEVFLNISGVSGYRPDDCIEHDECSNLENFDFFSSLCIDWEQAAKIKSSTCRQTIVRCGVVLGPGGGIIKNSYLPFNFGFGAQLGSGNQFFPWIHIEDLTRIFIYLIENDSLAGIVNAVAPEQITNYQFTHEFAAVLKKSARLTVPEFVLNMLLGKERAAIVTKGARVVPARLLNQPDFEFLYPQIRCALEEIVNC